MEDWTIAMEESIRHTMKVEYTIRDKYFPYVESFLPKTEHLLFRHISKYEDKYASLISSPYPTDIIPFGISENGEDSKIVFRCANIDEAELKAHVKKMPLPGKLTTEKAAFQPLQIVLFLMIRYYLLTKQPKKAQILYPYYGYSIYWKRWRKSFQYGLNKEVMIYTVEEMSYRNLLKRLGSVKALLTYIVDHEFEYYREGVVECCDEDIRYILDQIHSNIGSKVNSIASLYYDTNKTKNAIFTGKSLYDTGEQREDTSAMATAETLTQKYSHLFFSSPIDPSKTKTACILSSKDVSYKEVINTLEYIRSNASSQDIHDLYSAIFYYYLTLDDPKANANSIYSMYFVTTMKEVVKKGNSINKNIVTIINYMNQWLDASSNTFRLTSRPGTRTNYRKAVFTYFLLMVSNR